MLSYNFQKKIYEKIPPYPPYLYLRRFLKGIFLIKNFLLGTKGKFWLFLFKLRNIVLNKKLMRFELNNFSVLLLPYGGCTFGVWRRKNYEPEVMDFILKNIKKDAIFFDIGANVGIFSLAVAKKEKTAKVFAFEPASENFKALKKT